MRNNSSCDFQVFWDAYGVKRDRIAAERAWNRLSARDRRAALAGISGYRDDCEQRGVRMMYGQGYLNHRRWEDEQISIIANTNETIGVSSDGVSGETESSYSISENMEIW